MQTNIPKTSTALSFLLQADFRTQWRNRRSSILVILVPTIILISWKGLVDKIGGAFVLSNCITVGLTAVGLMGYTISIARDRDKGIFQRLRVAPVPNWSIMASRLIVQLFMILLMNLVLFWAGYNFDHITLTFPGYALCLLTSIIGGAMYLGLGQLIVGLIKNPESVNSTTRLVYFAFIMIGMFGILGLLGDKFKEVVEWTPYGTVWRTVAASLRPSTWTSATTGALGATLGYALVFAGIGIKNFKWNTK
jgi:ABC-2 type transport system permease protein